MQVLFGPLTSKVYNVTDSMGYQAADDSVSDATERKPLERVSLRLFRESLQSRVVQRRVSLVCSC
jgi:hypothetical protein